MKLLGATPVEVTPHNSFNIRKGQNVIFQFNSIEALLSGKLLLQKCLLGSSQSLQACPFIMMKRSCNSQKEMHSAFVKHMEEYNNVQIYTYGSKMESQVGFAPVLPAQMLNG